MTRRHYSSAAAATTLSSSVTSGATSITVGATTGFPVSFPYTLILDPETASEEVVTVSAAAGTTLTVARGADGTTALAHTSGAVVKHGVSARDFDEPNEHIDTEVGVHGVAGAVVGTSDTQTLTGKTISADDNDITGLAASSFVVTDGSGVVDGSAAQKAIPAGVVVGTSDTQTLTGKTLTTPTITNPLITLPVIVRASLTSDIAVSGGNSSDLTTWTEAEDGATAFDAASGAFTVPAGQGGLYLVTLDYEADNTSGGDGTGTFFLEVGGVANGPGAGTSTQDAAHNEAKGSLTRLLRLSAADVVTASYAASGTQTAVRAGTTLEIVKLSV